MERQISTLLLLLSMGCATMPAPEPDPSERQLTVGVVQKEIREGMSQADVAEAIGSPNIVTRDRDGIETWIYDKISSEARQESQQGYATLILIGFSESSSRSSQSERTLTVIIKFDQNDEVTSFTYQASKF